MVMQLTRDAQKYYWEGASSQLFFQGTLLNIAYRLSDELSQVLKYEEILRKDTKKASSKLISKLEGVKKTIVKINKKYKTWQDQNDQIIQKEVGEAKSVYIESQKQEIERSLEIIKKDNLGKTDLETVIKALKIGDVPDYDMVDEKEGEKLAELKLGVENLRKALALLKDRENCQLTQEDRNFVSSSLNFVKNKMMQMKEEEFKAYRKNQLELSLAEAIRKQNADSPSIRQNVQKIFSSLQEVVNGLTGDSINSRRIIDTKELELDDSKESIESLALKDIVNSLKEMSQKPFEDPDITSRIKAAGYKLDKPLGKGGYGTVYKAIKITPEERNSENKMDVILENLDQVEEELAKLSFLRSEEPLQDLRRELNDEEIKRDQDELKPEDSDLGDVLKELKDIADEIDSPREILKKEEIASDQALSEKKNYYAIKILQEPLSRSAWWGGGYGERQGLIQQENIIPIRHVIHTGKGIEAIVFDYVEAQDAYHKCLVAGLNIEDLKNYGRQLLQAALAMHRAHIVHHDIKPENILLDDQHKRLYLIDFGLADSSRYAPSEIYAGTKGTWSPEVKEGQSHGTSSDMWSIGMTLLYMITGDYHLLDMIEQDPTQITEKLSKRVENPELCEIIENLLILDPSQRWTAEQCLNHKFFKETI